MQGTGKQQAGLPRVLQPQLGKGFLGFRIEGSGSLVYLPSLLRPKTHETYVTAVVQAVQDPEKKNATATSHRSAGHKTHAAYSGSEGGVPTRGGRHYLLQEDTSPQEIMSLGGVGG